MATVNFAPGDPNTPSYLRTRANGWNGSRYVGLPAAPPPSPEPSPWRTNPPVPPVQLPPTSAVPRSQTTPVPWINYGGQGDPNNPTAIERQGLANRNRAPGTLPTPLGVTPPPPAIPPPAVPPLVPMPRAVEGFDARKLADPTLGTSHKYVGGRILAASGGVDDVLRDPLFAGWTRLSDDKIRSPEGAVYDLFRDASGANVPQWARQGGTGSAQQIAAGRAAAAARSAGGTMPASFGSLGDDNVGMSVPGTGATGTGYGDPNADLFANEVLSRLEALRTPITDPFLELLQSFGLDRVDDLEGAPYTAGEDAALRAQYMDPLTSARDAALERRREELGRFGYLPSSGLFQDQIGEIEQGYEQAVGEGSTDLAVRAIDERQRRGQEQLQILEGLLGISQDTRAETDARGREAVTTASLLPAFDERRLDQTLRASGQGSSDQNALMQTLMALMQMNQQNAQFNAQQQQQASIYNQQNAQADAAAWGRFLAGIDWSEVFG